MNDRLLTRIGERLQVDGLRMIEDDAPSGSEQIIEVADAERQSVARFAWRPKRPGEVTIVSIVPFVAVALVSFALLLLVIMRICGERRPPSPAASGDCVILRCTIRSADCQTGFIFRSGWSAQSPRCAVAASQPPSSTSISITSRTSTIDARLPVRQARHRGRD